MTTIKTALAAAALAFALSTGVAVAQTATSTTTPTTTTKTVKAPKEPKVTKPKTDISIACSKQADEKKLHGDERKKFRATCKKDAEKAAKAASPATTTTTAPKVEPKKN